MKIEEELEPYINYITLERQLSKNTIEGYTEDLMDFFKFVNKKHNNITREDITSYIMNISKDINAKSVNRHIVSIRNYFKYLSKNNYITENPCDDIVGLKMPKTIPHVLSEDDIDKLLNIEVKDAISSRNKAMLELMYSSGLRVSELLNLENSTT